MSAHRLHAASPSRPQPEPEIPEPETAEPATGSTRPRRRSRPRPWAVSLLAFGLVATACSSSDSDAGAGESDSVSADTQQSAADSGGESESASDPDQEDPPAFDYSTVDYEAEAVGSALRGDRRDPAFPPPVIEPARILSGGPPPDGIPAIENPDFIPISEVDFLGDDEAVILVEVDGDARAYPVQILIWHEIVNDQFGDVPVTVTYCPLCNSALAFDRRFGSRVLDFGTSGELFQSALVMYDRQTESLWAHFTGQGLVGHYAGAQLDFIPAQTISFAQFSEAHPDGTVLSRDTGVPRRYGENPYEFYDREDTDPIGRFFTGEIDRTLLAKARIVGIADGGDPVAVRFEDLQQQPVIPVNHGGRNLAVFHRPGLASALDDVTVGDGRDIGQTGVFVAQAADGTDLTFTSDGENFVDDETGTVWNVLGQALDGPLVGESLTAVAHLDTFWFAWATYRPDTIIIDI